MEKNSNKIVCYPFSKFFNFGEKYTAQMDWETAVFTEKLDGSLIKLYFLESENQWLIATNSTMDARSLFPVDLRQCIICCFPASSAVDNLVCNRAYKLCVFKLV